jgi:hypothetical protein
LLRTSSNVLELDMAKPTKRSPRELQIEAFAKRRAGGTYVAAAVAAKDRLINLRREYLDVPTSYRGYLTVGICTCLEIHLKYCYAYAAERFVDHPDLLKELYKDISVDIDTLISTSARSFHLSDVVAANIKVSSLDTYTRLASAFFTAIEGKRHSFPWDLSKVFGFGDDEEGKKLQAEQLNRLRQVFVARHDFVHETPTEPVLSLADPREYIDDAIHLINLFDKNLENIEMSPKFAAINHDEGLNDAVDRHMASIEDGFEKIKSFCERHQHEKLKSFKEAFVAYLWARCEFQASVFIAQRSESAMSDFLDLAPQYRKTLDEIALRQKRLLAEYPLARQYTEMGIELDDNDASKPS